LLDPQLVAVDPQLVAVDPQLVALNPQLVAVDAKKYIFFKALWLLNLEIRNLKRARLVRTPVDNSRFLRLKALLIVPNCGAIPSACTSCGHAKRVQLICNRCVGRARGATAENGLSNTGSVPIC
jgi:hypothetical protein